jgi:phospholipid transport system substrate-binding protein
MLALMLTPMKSLLLFAAFFLGLLGTSQANESVKLATTFNAALDTMYSEAYLAATPQQQQAQVRQILENSYDLHVIIRRSLARNWRLLSPQEQVTVSDLITQLVVKSLVESLQGQTRPIVECEQPIIITSKRMEIPTVITVPGQASYNVLYRFGLLSSGWQIYDIVAEHISLTSNYRQQFDDHFRKKDGAQLIALLQDLLASEPVSD